MHLIYFNIPKSFNTLEKGVIKDIVKKIFFLMLLKQPKINITEKIRLLIRYKKKEKLYPAYNTLIWKKLLKISIKLSAM